MAAASAAIAGHHPRAFGRTSNVWQYIEGVQDRTTPKPGLRKPSLDSLVDEADNEELGTVRDPLVAFATTSDRRKRSSLQNNQSLPELPVLSNGAGPMDHVVRSPKTHPGVKLAGPVKRTRVAVNGQEVIKRIQALGTSASMPLLTPTSGNLNPVLAPQSSTAQALAATAAAAPVVSDAEKLRNDFNSQPSKLYYGCSVALELFNGHIMMVGSPDGLVRVQSLESLQAPQIKGCRDRAIFTLIDLTDVRSANTIRYGDAVWLQLSIGPGETSWEQGGVLGAKVREAPQLKALALSSEDQIRNTAQAPLVVGQPVPVKAYLPKSRDDGDTQADEIQARVRNKSSKMLGKWIIRSAQLSERKHSDTFVYNNDEIYLEQDWFYLGADSDAGVAVLRQLPPSSALKDIKKGEYVIERRAAWRIRLLDSSNGSSGLSLAQQQMEKLLLRAKTQLKQSKKMRTGHGISYGPGLNGGSGFSKQLRRQVASSTRECNGKYRDRQEKRLERLELHFAARAEGLKEPFALRGKTSTELIQQQSAIGRNAAASSPKQLTQKIAPEIDRRREMAVAVPSASPSAAESAELEDVCTLCRSATIGFNLCCQFHRVMAAVEGECAAAEATATGRQLSQRSMLKSSGGKRGGASDVDSTQGPILNDATSTLEGTAAAETDDDPVDPDSPTMRKSVAGSSFSTSQQQQQQQLKQQKEREQSRIFELFAQQDAKMMEIIEFKQKEALDAVAAEEQARVGLSPVATHFRDRFKHVGLLAQSHQQDAYADNSGIGGHFHRLREQLQLTAPSTPLSQPSQTCVQITTPHVLQHIALFGAPEYPDPTTQLRTCPLEFPPEGFDVYGRAIDLDAADPVQTRRLFPNEQEMDLLPPVDTKAALELYLQNRSAMGDMLDGFVDLVESQMLPSLQSAMDARNRTSLVELLDFAARAAEFVCARRVQVQIARLLHAMAESEVGDFESFAGVFETLLGEFQGTAAFIRFFRDQQMPIKARRGAKKR